MSIGMNTIISQGTFTATGAAKIITLPSNADWMEVINYSQAGVTTTTYGYRYLWRRGMAAGTGTYEYHFDTAAADHCTAVANMTDGFTLINTTNSPVGAPIVFTAVSNAAPSVVSTAATTGLVTNTSVVRLSNGVGCRQLCGIDWTVGTVTPATNFSLRYITTAPVAAAAPGATAYWRKIAYDPIFYPRRRTITNISQAASAVITMSVEHGYTVGQKVRLLVPSQWGMVEMNNLTGTITAQAGAGTNTITVDIDSTGFTAFAWPVDASVPFTTAQVVPIGEDLVVADNYSDQTYNTGYMGMYLGVGAAGDGTNGPCGANTNVMYWMAGVSYSTNM